MPNENQIREQLQRLLTHDSFAASPRSGKLLTYLVEKTLAEEQSEIKGYTIGVDVFDRGDDFDPQSDSIVRVQAGRLRKALSLYYLTDGVDDRIVIQLPKGRYVPAISFRDTKPDSNAASNIEMFDNASAKNKNEDGLNKRPIRVGDKGSRNQLEKINFKLTFLTVFLGALVLILLGFLYLQVPTSSYKTTFDKAALMPSGPSITVLPFETSVDENTKNIGQDGRTLSVGLQYELINNLSKFRELKIVTSKDEWSPFEVPVSVEVTTDYYLTGVIQVRDNAVRISSALFRTRDNQSIWSKTYDETLEQARGILGIQSAMASDVSAILGQAYSPINEVFERGDAISKNDEFRHLYCLFQFYEYSSNKTQELHADVRFCLEEAVKENPDFSSGWAALSWMYGDEERNGFNPVTRDRTPYEMSLMAAETAVVADRQNAMAYQYLAIISFAMQLDHIFRFAASKALELNPNDPDILANVGGMLVQSGDGETGARMIEKGINLSLNHPPWYHFYLSLHYYMEGDMVEGLKHATDYLSDGGLQSKVMYISLLVQNNEIERARREFEHVSKTYPIFQDNYEALLISYRFPQGMYERVLEDLKLAGLKVA